MSRYLLHLAYSGHTFAGWQYQKNIDHTIQQNIEDVLTSIIKKPVRIHGCGRTDAGVHAAQYIAHMDIAQEINENFIKITNFQLPESIVLYDIIPVDADFNAQTMAISRTYDYFFSTDKDPFWHNQVAYYGGRSFDVSKMKKVLPFMVKVVDFSNMCLQPDKHHHTNCRISEARLWYSESKQLYGVRVTSNRFLRGMMRILIAKVLDVGAGRISSQDFLDYLQNKKERKHKNQAYPQGLYLAKVSYPDFSLPIKNRAYLSLLKASGGTIPQG